MANSRLIPNGASSYLVLDGHWELMGAAANAAAVAPTTAVDAAAGDEVAAAVTSLFAAHGQAFQALSAQAAAFHTQFVRVLTGAGATVDRHDTADDEPPAF